MHISYGTGTYSLIGSEGGVLSKNQVEVEVEAHINWLRNERKGICISYND
jgi:hypothetical protein